MFKQRNEKKVIRRYQIKVLVGTCISIIIMIGLQYLGVKPPHFEVPIPAKIDALDTALPFLEERSTTYTIYRPLTFVPIVHASEEYDNASAYAVIDFDSGEVLFDKNLSQKLPIASITKVMSAVVSLDLASPEDIFTVSKNASQIEPTKIGVLPGQKYTLEELIKAMILTSANDAAEVVREGINMKYKGDVFIRAMNEKARFIGMKQTHFTNAQGFDVGDPFSTVEDLALLSHYALKTYPLIAQVAEIDYEFLPATGTHPQVDLYNWNGLLGVYPGISGLKIGNTDNAGRTIVVVAERNGKKLLAILLGAPGVLERDIWTAQLLDRGFALTSNALPIGVTEVQLKEKYATWKYW